MDINTIETLVSMGESDILEFKKSTGLLEQAFQTICAFLNGKGGQIIIGGCPNGKIVGQEISDKTKQEIANKKKRIEPHANIDVEYLFLPNSTKCLIVIHVPKGNHAPYTYEGRTYQKNESTTSLMSQHKFEQLIISRNQLNYSWEKQAADYDIKNLDQDLILSVVRRAVESGRLPESALRQTIEQILKSLQLIEDETILNAAVVLFGRRFLPNYPQCQIRLATFKGNDKHEFIDNDLVYGNTFELLDRSMSFLKRHLPTSGKIIEGQFERSDKLLIPFIAIREAIINSLCHRDYSSQGGSVALAIYEDRMEISNEGGLSAGLTIDKIKKGYSKPRNPLLADVFYRCNLIEKWGRGIQEMINSCLSVGDPEPTFYSDSIEFKVTFYLPKKYPIISTVSHELSERQKAIIEIISNQQAASVQLILKKLKHPPSQRMVQKDLNYLQSLELIEKSGIGKKVKWILKIKKH